MGKNISLIGNPGVGKTTFFLAMLHQLDKIGWAPQNWKTLPEKYEDWIEAMIAGERINPTLKLNLYSLNLRDFQYKNSIVKTGWFGRLSIKIRDIQGDDYRRTTETFKEAVNGVSAVLAMIDPTCDKDLGSALVGQIAPLVRSMRYIAQNERNVKYVGFIFTKRALHGHPIKKIRHFIEDQLGAMVNAARRSGLIIRMLEVESRGLYNRLEPWGVEEVIYDLASHVCKVEGTKYDVTRDPDYDWRVYSRKQGTRNSGRNKEV
jgi:hypothetical protein